MKNRYVEWESGKKISIDDVRQVERELAISFPEEYVQIVLEHDGGLPNPSSYKTISGIEEMLGQLIPIKEIAERIELMVEDDWYVENSIPIYQDGNYAVCLDYREDKLNPKVFFSNASHFEVNPVEPISNNFKEFLDLIYGEKL